ncbi:hypothetical protein Glove_50g38 [Diversispora epigaea]|uniref:Serine-threonine/tyrosine-protein kinase catalytic domain-containing protein n=1 Tax=Diversispora epigaea TaxID=1348612 RepID=A0A397JMR1_9GLOM|nr:hypothetical protein Glove_50g38 [Diversispora epigaea]
MWVDGYINDWGIKNHNGEDLMTIYLRTSGNKITSTTLYGITKDSETHEYMMVLKYFKGGSLRNYLNNTFNNINWYNKLDYLKDFAGGFSEIHKLDIVHPLEVLSGGEFTKAADNNNNEITIQIKDSEEFPKNLTTYTTTPTNYKTHPQAIYTSRLLNFSDISKPKNDENFEKKLEELT